MAKQIIDQPLDSGNANTNSVDKNNSKPTRNNKVVKPIDALKNSRNIEAIQTTANYNNAKKEFAKASHGMIHKKYADAQSAIEDGKAYREAEQNFQESRLKYNKDKDEEEYLKAGGDSIDINYNTKRLDEISKEEKELRSRVSDLSNKLNDINGTLSNEEQIELANINKQLSEMNSEEEKLQKELSVAKNHLENVAYDKAVQEGNQEEADYYADIIRARDYNFGETVGMAIGKSIANIAQYAAVLAHVLKDNALENAANNLNKTYKESLEKGEISQETFDRAMEMTKQWQDYDAMKQPFVQSIREDQKKLDAMLNSAYSHDGVVERFIEQGISSSADFLVKYGLFKGGTTAVFGLQSYTERYAELSEAVDENGNPLYTKEQIEKNAVWTGLASYLTEKIGMDSFAKILTGGASKYIYGHAFDYLFKSLVQQGLAEGSEEIIEALADGIIDSITLGTPIEYNAGDIFYSFILGAFSGVLMGAGASVSFTVSTTQQYNALKNDIDTLKGLRKKATSQEEIQKIDNAIFVGENALNNFEEKSRLGLAVNMQNDNVNQNSTTQEVEAEMAEAITPNVEEAFETANQIENVVSNITNVSKQLLLQKGIDMNVNQYVELSQEEKNDVNKLSENFNKAIKHINLGFDTSAPVNGYILSSKNGKPTIIVNPKSPTLGGTLTTVSAVHELVHSIENTDEYKKIVSLLDQDKLKAKTNELSKGLYRGADNPQSEAVAKELSENIIDSNEFIEHLAKYNTSFAYRVLYKLRGAVEILGDSDQSERIIREFTNALNKQPEVYFEDGVHFSKVGTTNKQINKLFEEFDKEKVRIDSKKAIPLTKVELKERIHPKWAIDLMLSRGPHVIGQETILASQYSDYDEETLKYKPINHTSSGKESIDRNIVSHIDTFYGKPFSVWEGSHGVLNGSYFLMIKATSEGGYPIVMPISEAGHRSAFGKVQEVTFDDYNLATIRTSSTLATGLYGKSSFSNIEDFLNKSKCLWTENDGNISSLDENSKEYLDAKNKSISSIREMQLNAKGKSYIDPSIIGDVHKAEQLSIVEDKKPMTDDYHTGIREISDILTFEETISDPDDIITTEDYTEEDIKKAISEGEITVYSSYPIENGVFVTPSKTEAQNYAGEGRVYEKRVALQDVAWIDNLEGQYAETKDILEKDVPKSAVRFSLIDVNNPTRNEEILNKYNPREIEITHNNGDYILNVDYSIKEFYDKVKGTNSNSKLWLGILPEEITNRIKKDTNIDLSGKSLVISASSINHIDKHHNDNNYKKYGNPKPITIDDYNNLANILNNYSTVEHEEKNGEDRLKFVTKTNNNYDYLVLEIVPKRDKSVVLLTMYATKKGALQGVSAGTNAPSHVTSANDGNGLNYTPYINNISKNSVSVNGETNSSSNNGENVGDIHTNSEYVQKNAQELLTSENNNDSLNLQEDNKEGASNEFRRIQEESERVLAEGSWGRPELHQFKNESIRRRYEDVFRKELGARGYSDSNPNGLLENTGDFKIYKNVDGQTFHDIFNTVRTYLPYGELVDVHPLETNEDWTGYNDTYNYLSDDGMSGFAITKDGDLISVFNASGKKGFLRSIAPFIKENAKTLDCYVLDPNISGTNLKKLYGEIFGFEVSNEEDYNWDYDHDGIGERYNEPKIAYMYNPNYQETVNEQENPEEYPVGFSRALGQNIETEYQRNLNKYGAFEPGEEPRQDIKVPKATDYGKTSQFARNYAEAPNLTNEDSILDFAESINNGLFSYVESTNKEKVDDANKKLDRIGIEKMYEEVMNNSNITPRLIAEESVVLRKLSAKNDSRATQLAIKMANDATVAGQTLQAFQILKRLTPEGQLSAAYQSMQRMQAKLDAKYGNKAPTLQISDDLAEKLRTAKTNEEIDRARKDIADSLAEQVPSSFSDQIRAWRYLSMLGNPTTHIRNFLGNALFAPLINVKNSIGAVLEDVTDKALKATKKQGLEYKTKSILNPFSQKYKDLYKAGEEEYDFVKGSIEKNHKYEQQSFSKKTWLGRALNKVSNINSLALDKEDFIFSKARFADSYAQYLNANGLDPKTISADMQHRANAYAMREAQKATYRDFNSVADWLNKLEYSTQKGLRMASFVKDAVVPFTRTPMNIVKRGMEYSPIGLAKTILYDSSQLYQNKITVNDYIDNLSSGLTGTGIVLIGALLKGLGIFRTKDDDASRKQNFDKDNGEQDYSIDLSPLGLNGTYTIDWMAPEIMPLAMGAELYDVFSGLQNSNGKNVIDAVADVSARLMDPVMETTMLSSLKQTLSSYANSGGEWFGDMVGSVVSSYISQFFPTVGGKIARAIDETRRTTYPNSGLIDKTIKTIANKIPFASMTNQPYINTSGQETKNTGGNFFGRLAFNLLSPGNYSNKELDKYDEEIYRLYNSTGDINAFPSNKSNSTTYDKEKYDLSESDYTKFNKTRLSLEDKYVKEFIDSASYEDYTDEEKVETLKDIRKYALDAAKEQYLKGEGVNYNDKWYTKANEAINNKKIDVVDYFDYLNREGTNQAETVKYLESTDLTKKQKEYLYSQNDWKTSYEDAYSKVFGKSEQKANNTGDSFFSQRR